MKYPKNVREMHVSYEWIELSEFKSLTNNTAANECVPIGTFPVGIKGTDAVDGCTTSLKLKLGKTCKLECKPGYSKCAQTQMIYHWDRLWCWLQCNLVDVRNTIFLGHMQTLHPCTCVQPQWETVFIHVSRTVNNQTPIFSAKVSWFTCSFVNAQALILYPIC